MAQEHPLFRMCKQLFQEQGHHATSIMTAGYDEQLGGPIDITEVRLPDNGWLWEVRFTASRSNRCFILDMPQRVLSVWPAGVHDHNTSLQLPASVQQAALDYLQRFIRP